MIGGITDLVDTLRVFRDAGPGIESLGGLVELMRRTALRDFHPSAIWAFHAANTPDKPALVQGERRVTWKEANSTMNRLANGLRAAGIEPGDRVAVMLKNSIEWFEVMVGCQRIGASTVSVSYRSTAPELRYLLENSNAKMLIFDAEHAPVIREARAGVALAPDRYVAIGRGANGEFTSYEHLLARSPEDEPPAELRQGGARTVLYTSGTTGKPKGAVRDLSKVGLGSALGLLRRVPFRRSDRHLVAAPLYHVTASGFAILHVSLGCTVVIMEKFDPVEFLAAVDREKITTSALVPTMIRAILEVPLEQRAKYDTSSLRIIISTGSALPDELEKAARETLGEVIYDLYGSTEMAQVTIATPEDKRLCPGTIGLAVPGVDVVLLDDERRPVKDGEVGEVFARSDLTIEGYHANDAATQESRFGDYFSVGDLAVRDSRGYLKLVGRKKDMVISGGMNVYPAEIEAVLTSHPAIREAGVVGLPDEKWGEALVAFVVAKEGAEIPSDDELVAFLKKSLAGYKVPRRFERVAELPRNPTGKILKQELRAVLATSAQNP
jgi:long-chain acyl-CoA synthetase